MEACSESDLRLFDLHCHVSFALEARDLSRDLDSLGIGCLSATVSPSDYEHATTQLMDAGNVHLGAGLHPWWLADGRCGSEDVERLEALVSACAFIGEVGLDFAGARVSSRDMQLMAFERVAEACANQGGKVLSIHAVHAAGEVLDVLERSGCIENNACIFHWFSGSSDELHRAVARGCFFSVGERMLSSKKGREYAKAIPADQLLLETDLPSEPGSAASAASMEASLERASASLAALRGNEVSACIARTSATLLGFL